MKGGPDYELEDQGLVPLWPLVNTWAKESFQSPVFKKKKKKNQGMGPGEGAQREAVIIPALSCKTNMRIQGVHTSENAFRGGIFYIQI